MNKGSVSIAAAATTIAAMKPLRRFLLNFPNRSFLAFWLVYVQHGRNPLHESLAPGQCSNSRELVSSRCGSFARRAALVGEVGLIGVDWARWGWV